MKKEGLHRGWIVLTIASVISCVALLESCHKDDTVTSTTNTASAAQDAATSVANALAINNGGIIDQIGDVSDIASAASSQSEAGVIFNKYAFDSVYTNVSKSYDSTTEWWTLTLDLQRFGDYRTATFTRVYQYQFLNSSNAPQKYWLSGTDTAYSMHFKIVSGTGTFTNLYISHHLFSLSGEWMVTGTNTNVFTINTVNGGLYTRVGADTLSTYNAIRTLNDSLSLTFTNVTGPRGSRLLLQTATSGTITGTYDAVVSFTSGSLYAQRTIHDTISITLANGVAHIYINGVHFRADCRTGAIL